MKGEEVRMMPLTMVNVGEVNKIRKIGGNEETRRFLENLGFVAGSEVTVLSTIGGNVIVNIKDSSVLNVIAVTELFYRINDIATTNYAFLECYLILAVIYLILTLIASLCLKLVEKKLDGVKFSLNPFRFKRGEL